jgi:hypothetical protein
MAMDNEAVVILSDADNVQTSSSVTARARVSQVGSARVMVVDADPATLGQLRELPGVLGVMMPGDAVPESAGLNDQELLFVKGWQVSKQPKQRRGEGLPWDAPGFDAPGANKK